MQYQNPIFIPGPTNIPDSIRRAMAQPAWDHRTAAFDELIVPLCADIRRVFGTEQGDVALFTGSGTTGWDIAMGNLLAPGERVLAANQGMFSQRWIDLARRMGLDVEVVEVEWGEGLPLETFESILAADTAGAIRAVLAVHNETSTGVTSEIGRLKAVLDGCDHDALLMVDGVSSVASLPFEMDRWGVDVAVSGSQKGFMLPTGLAIVAVSQRAQAQLETVNHAQGHLDLRTIVQAGRQGGYPWTPAIGLIQALRVSVDLLLGEGLPQVYARHTHMARGVRAAVNAWGLSIFAKDPALYSDTVTAIALPDAISGKALVAHANDRYGMSFGGGLGAFQDRLFRIGHLGSTTESMILSGLATAEMAMADLGVPLDVGAGVAAAQQVYREGGVAG